VGAIVLEFVVECVQDVKELVKILVKQNVKIIAQEFVIIAAVQDV